MHEIRQFMKNDPLLHPPGSLPDPDMPGRIERAKSTGLAYLSGELREDAKKAWPHTPLRALGAAIRFVRFRIQSNRAHRS